MFTWLGGLIEGTVIMSIFGTVIIAWLKKEKEILIKKAKEMEDKIKSHNNTKL